MPTQVILPTYTISSWAANVDDDFGCRWVIEPGGASFVTDGVARKMHSLERPFGSGAYRSRSYPAARSGVLQGWCDAGSREGRVAARKRLMRIFPEGGTALLVVDDGIDPQQITAELDADTPRCAVWADGCGFDWQIPLYAADGRFLSTSERRAQATLSTAAADGLDWGIGGGPPAFVGAGTASTGSNFPRTPGMPAGVAAGDVLLIFAAIRNAGAGTPDAPAGYTTLVDGGNMRLFGKVYDGAEAAPTVTYTGGVAGATNFAQIVAFRGVSLTVLGAAAQPNAAAATVAYPALNLAQAATVLYLGWQQAVWTGAATVAGAAEIGDFPVSTGDGAAHVWDYAIQSTPANVPAGAFAITGGSSAISAGAVVALAPATGIGLDWANGGLDWGASSANSVLALANDGSATAYPLLTITTPSGLQNPTFTDPLTGGVLSYTGSLVAGQTLRIDCDPFNPSPVTLDGIDRTGALGAAKFIEIPPGASRAIQFTGIGAGTAVATWRDASN
ncbi:hypothetical protein AB0383_19680 [Amycolatopsis sp. NPDC051373]|uniref:hypothetical protein n=1 Tax=Amycolatopsis sp. NPDC051373 TaxID=3155801 RepID=UPI00344CF7EA